MSKGVSGAGVATAAVGSILLWSGLKGVKVTRAIRALIEGKEPPAESDYPIFVPEAGAAGAVGEVLGGDAAIGLARGNAQQILAIAASKKGQRYVFGGGHGENPCASNVSDCSGYVSCVLRMAGIMPKGSMTTQGLAKIGRAVPYAQRQPGDLIVWNGGTGGGHVGIIVDGNRMWNNPCTTCGGVQISRYPSGSRTAASAVIRRVT